MQSDNNWGSGMWSTKVSAEWSTKMETRKVSPVLALWVLILTSIADEDDRIGLVVKYHAYCVGSLVRLLVKARRKVPSESVAKWLPTRFDTHGSATWT